MKIKTGLAISGFITGSILLATGATRYTKEIEENSIRKQEAFKTMAYGAVAIIFGIGMTIAAIKANNRDITNKTLEIINRSMRNLHMKVTQGPLMVLSDILGKVGETSLTGKLFTVLKETRGISLDNYLPWKSYFHAGGTGYIDGIRPRDLKQPVMWGIDQWKRPYIAIKYLSRELNEQKAEVGAVAFFQRYTNDGNLLVPGGYFQTSTPLFDVLKAAIPSKEIFENLSTLFKGQFNGQSLSYDSWFTKRTVVLQLLE